MKEILKKLWGKLDGWKTIIGFVGHSVLLASNIKWNYATLNQELIGHTLIGQITGVGLGHKLDKFSKTESGKKTIKTISKLINKK